MIRPILCGLAFASVTMAQGPPKGGGNTPVTTPPLANPARTTTPTPTQTPDLGQSRTQVTFITGKVVLEDGTPPPESVVLERICGPIRRLEARTDMKGHFSFQVGSGASNSEQIMDASSDRIPTGIPNTNSSTGLGSSSKLGLNDPNSLRGCDLHAVLPGYQSSNVNLTMHSNFDSPDIGVIVLKRLGGRDGDTISMTNALAPKDAKKAFDKSRQLIAKGNWTDARKELMKAVDLYPKYASAWAELGRLQMDGNEVQAARQSFQKSLEADPKYLPPYDRLAVLALRDRNWPDLLQTTERLLKLNGYDYPQAYYYNALANLNLKRPDAAEKSAREALKQDPQKFVRAHYVWGLALAQRGEFASGAEQVKAYLATAPQGPDVDMIRKQLTEIEKLASEQTASRQEP